MGRTVRALVALIGVAVGVIPAPAQADSAAADFDVPGTGATVGVVLGPGVYTVKAYGIVGYDTTSFGPSYADPECTSADAHLAVDSIAETYHLYPSPLSRWQSHRYAASGFPTDLLDLEVDGIAPEWVPLLPTPVGYDPAAGGPGVDAGCNESTHTYGFVLSSIGANHTFRIYDPNPADNTGSIHVTIERLT